LGIEIGAEWENAVVLHHESAQKKEIDGTRGLLNRLYVARDVVESGGGKNLTGIAPPRHAESCIHGTIELAEQVRG
jgi:hypothetical protein